MTGGTIFYLTDTEIIYSDEFNGDMYLEGGGHAGDILERLNKVNNIDEFRITIEEFNKKNHNYEYFSFHSRPYPSRFTGELEWGYIDNNSDYDYIKNGTGKVVIFKDKEGKKVALESNGICMFNFGRRYLKMYPEDKE